MTELKKGEEEAGVRRVLRIIRTYRPKVVCFIGKIAFNTFYGSRKCDWGWQPTIAGARVYLMHFPIRGLASVRLKELKEAETRVMKRKFRPTGGCMTMQDILQEDCKSTRARLHAFGLKD